jgi:hypothetical protein
MISRSDLAFASLAGLSIGDALGAQYFVPGHSYADLAAHTGIDGIPADWLAAREPLPEWVSAVGGR